MATSLIGDADRAASLAFLVNDAICLVLSPLVLDLTLALKGRPL